MKSLFILNDFPPIQGGQSNYYYHLCLALPSEEILVLAPRITGCQNFDQDQSFRIARRHFLVSIPWIEKIIKIVLPFFYSLRLIKKENIQMIHCGHVLSTGFIGLLQKKIWKRSYIVYTHSADILEYQKIPILKKCLNMILFNASHIVANSEFTKEELLKMNIEEGKIIKINPRIDTKKFSLGVDFADILEKYQLKDKKVVLSVNRLVERKGNDMVIKVFPRILKEVPDAVYIIAGEGPCLEKLKALVEEYQLTNSVLIIGSINFEELVKLYKACDVFVMMSREIKEKGDVEGFGIVFLEANAAGKPVIGGNSGGIKDAVVDGETGLLVDPLNEQEIILSITKLLKDKNYANGLAQKGQARAVKHFDWRNGIAELDFLFSDSQKEGALEGSQPSYQQRVVDHYATRDPYEQVALSRQALYKNFLNRVRYLKTDKSRLLDIGCGAGSFLALAKKDGWDVFGLEPVEKLARYAKERVSPRIQNTDIECASLEQQSFDMVTLWNVLDELDSPLEDIKKIKQVLKKDGYIFIRVPNIDFHLKIKKFTQFFEKTFFSKWIPRDITIFHTFGFSASSMRELLKENGFKNIKIRNSALTKGDPYLARKGIGRIKPFIFFLAECIASISFGKILIAPSIELMANLDSCVKEAS